MRFTHRIVGYFIVFLFTGSIKAQITINGTIRDQENHPIQGATLDITPLHDSTKRQHYMSANGAFGFNPK